ncbi:response regulator [Corynebacterium sp. ATCC 6931]|nr:response regulator [Corynebacterium sp. ATCC 6931]
MSSKILVVDDDPAIAEMLTMVMEREGFDTVVVDDGIEAVKAAERENPDLILLDLMLPGIGGADHHVDCEDRHGRCGPRPGIRCG